MNCCETKHICSTVEEEKEEEEEEECICGVNEDQFAAPTDAEPTTECRRCSCPGATDLADLADFGDADGDMLPPQDALLSHLKIEGRFHRLAHRFAAPSLHLLTTLSETEVPEMQEEEEDVDMEGDYFQRFPSLVAGGRVPSKNLPIISEADERTESEAAAASNLEPPTPNAADETEPTTGSKNPIVLETEEDEVVASFDKEWCRRSIERIMRQQRDRRSRSDAAELQGQMAELLDLKDFESDLDDAIVLDVFVAAIRFAADKKFHARQAIHFLCLIHQMHAKIERRPIFARLVKCLHAHVYNRAFAKIFTEEQIEEIIQYVSATILQDFRLHRLYTLVSFVHETEENPELLKISGRRVHDVYLRYETQATTVVPHHAAEVFVEEIAAREAEAVAAAEAAAAASGKTEEDAVSRNIHRFHPLSKDDYGSYQEVVDDDYNDDNFGYLNFNIQSHTNYAYAFGNANSNSMTNANANDDNDQNLGVASPKSQKSDSTVNGSRQSPRLHGDADLTVNRDSQHAKTGKSKGSVTAKATGAASSKFLVEDQLLPPLLPPAIPPLCEAMSTEMREWVDEADEERERKRIEEEELYNLLHPKVLTSAEHLERYLDECSAPDLLALVSSTIDSKVRKAATTLEERVEKQKTQWGAGVDKVEALVAAKAAGPPAKGKGGKGKKGK